MVYVWRSEDKFHLVGLRIEMSSQHKPVPIELSLWPGPHVFSTGERA